jgi:hypothetical protein
VSTIELRIHCHNCNSLTNMEIGEREVFEGTCKVCGQKFESDGEEWVKKVGPICPPPLGVKVQEKVHSIERFGK